MKYLRIVFLYIILASMSCWKTSGRNTRTVMELLLRQICMEQKNRNQPLSQPSSWEVRFSWLSAAYQDFCCFLIRLCIVKYGRMSWHKSYLKHHIVCLCIRHMLVGRHMLEWKRGHADLKVDISFFMAVYRESE